MKEISFLLSDEFGGITNNDPVPGSKKIPSWFTKLNSTLNGSNNPVFQGAQNDFTVKKCPPFLDAFLTGYIISTEYDIVVESNNSGASFHWAGGGELISEHSAKQISEHQIPDGYCATPYKWLNKWAIKTPLGYSAIITHPLNRTDLPFQTIAGIVETDVYTNVVNFPFFIKSNFSGIIPAGTPIAQIIPLKREKWVNKKGFVSKEERFKIAALHFSKLIYSYKSRFWVRKEYN